MELSDCTKCLKYTFFIFNVLFSIFGAAAVCLGIWAAADYRIDRHFHESVKNVIPDLSTGMVLSAAILIIIAGAIVLFIGCLGCTGAWRESQCLLATFFAILLLITLLLITATSLAFALPSGMNIVIQPNLEAWMHNKNFTDLSPDRQQNINHLQKELKCCGALGPSSFAPEKAPDSCEQGGVETIKSCTDAIREEFFKNKAYALALGGIGAILIVLLVVGMVLSLLLCCAIRSKSDPEWSAVQSNDQEDGDKE